MLQTPMPLTQQGPGVPDRAPRRAQRQQSVDAAPCCSQQPASPHDQAVAGTAFKDASRQDAYVGPPLDTDSARPQSNRVRKTRSTPDDSTGQRQPSGGLARHSEPPGCTKVSSAGPVHCSSLLALLTTVCTSS